MSLNAWLNGTTRRSLMLAVFIATSVVWLAGTVAARVIDRQYIEPRERQELIDRIKQAYGLNDVDAREMALNRELLNTLIDPDSPKTVEDLDQYIRGILQFETVSPLREQAIVYSADIARAYVHAGNHPDATVTDSVDGMRIAYALLLIATVDRHVYYQRIAVTGLDELGLLGDQPFRDAADAVRRRVLADPDAAAPD
ncbi:MAG: hypothetical protein KDA25_13165 [Phycisphaerales bacterium]|nr:hypothetical protein [Phycisphaerales bacterium]